MTTSGIIARRTLLLAAVCASTALGLGRRPYGGRLRFSMPLSVEGIDPHSLDDPASALFCPAAFDTLFALDGRGRPFPALAASSPLQAGRDVRVSLRPGLVSARGRKLSAADARYSILRSRASGGAGLLANLAEPKLDAKRPLDLVFPNTEPARVAGLLANPVTALVPRGFNRLRPDGTGAFLAEPNRRGLVMKRNERAARGPAFLDRIEIERASDLGAALRSFEAGDADVGWLGRGLHRPRPRATAFDAGVVGWVTLRTGQKLGDWGAPGVAQRLVDSLPGERFAHLGLDVPKASGSASRWGGPNSQIWVDGAAPQLVEVARALAGMLTSDGHRLEVSTRSSAEIAAARKSGGFPLMLEFLRRIGATGEATAAALFTAADPATARRPPKLPHYDARVIARTLPLGIIGELHLSGAHLPELHDLAAWDLGRVWLERRG